MGNCPACCVPTGTVTMRITAFGVTAVSAVALAAPAREKLLAKLQKMTGKNVVLTETVDPSVLGGLRLDMGGKRLDGTVQRHLERLREEIDGAVL